MSRRLSTPPELTLDASGLPERIEGDSRFRTRCSVYSVWLRALAAGSPYRLSSTAASPTAASPTAASPTAASLTAASPTAASPTAASPTSRRLGLVVAGAARLEYLADLAREIFR